MQLGNGDFPSPPVRWWEGSLGCPFLTPRIMVSRGFLLLIPGATSCSFAWGAGWLPLGWQEMEVELQNLRVPTPPMPRLPPRNKALIRPYFQGQWCLLVPQ